MVTRSDPLYEQLMRCLSVADYAVKRAEKQANKTAFALTNARVGIAQARHALKRMVR